MAEIANLVVDASVAGRWFLKDEPYSLSAVTLRQDFEQGIVRLYAPVFCRVEVGSILSKATRRADRPNRPSLPEGWQAITDFLAMNLSLVENEVLMSAAYGIATRYGCSYYDALYMALAQRLNCPFVHADDKLRRTLRNQFSLELWIEQYATPHL